MALDKQKFAMSVVGGIDTKTDQKNILPTNWAELENVNFNKLGRFTKRFGVDQVTSAVSDGTTITSCAALSTFKDELLLYSPTKLYSYSSTRTRWISRGTVNQGVNKEYAVSANSTPIDNVTMASGGGYDVYLYREHSIDVSSNSHHIVCKVVDTSNNTVVIESILSDTVSTVPDGHGAIDLPVSIVYSGTHFLLFYRRENVTPGTDDIRIRTIDVTTPETISSSTLVTSTSLLQFDSALISSFVFLFTSDGIIWKYTTAGVFVTSVGFSVTAAGNPYPVAINSETGGASIRVTYSQNGINILTRRYTTSLVLQNGPGTVLATASLLKLTSIQDPTNNTISWIFITYAEGTTRRYTVTGNTITDMGIFSTTSSRLYSHPMVINGAIFVVMCRYYFTLDASNTHPQTRAFYLMRIGSDAEAVSYFHLLDGMPEFAPGDGVGGTAITLSKHLAQVVSNSNDIYFPATIITEPLPGGFKFDTGSATYTMMPTALRKMKLDFSQSVNYFESEMSNNLHIAGGVLKMYDSANVVEHNFIELPIIGEQTAIETVGTATTFSIGEVYNWISVFSWTDEFGQLHRSATSLPYSHTVVANCDTITFDVESPIFTSKPVGTVKIELYRTENNGSLYYKVGENFSNSAGEFAFADTMADADLPGNELLYTTGDILDNFPCPPSKYITSYKGRLISLSADGLAINYSKLQRDGEPVNFAAEFSIPIDAKGGAATSLAVMDDHVLIFKEDSIYALTGEGPNDAGQQDDFRSPYLITTDTGCSNQNSIVITPDGIMFKSAKGIYLMRRGFSVEYIGAPVEDYNSLTLTSATLLSTVNQVRFTTDEGRTLVYDYFVKLWTTHTGPYVATIDSQVYNGVFYFAKTDGGVYSESASFSDAGSYIPIKLVSAWIQPGGIQGYQRFYRMLILGEYKNSHNFVCSYGYDFASTYEDTVTMNTSAISTDLYQIQANPKRQKCQAFRFKIEDTTTGTIAESLSLSNFAAIIGIKKGLNKVAATHIIAAD